MLPHVEADRLSVRYPVLTSSARSLKHRFLSRTTGGRISGERGIVEVQALSEVSFTFSAGERVGLIGHNGSGKSTLLRVLAGIYFPSAGAMRVNGRVAAVFDTAFGMDPDSTGYENIILRGLYLGIGTAEMRRRIPDIAAFTELGDFLDMPLRTYSAGMAARLAFAISTTVEADILLLDEGVTGGDDAFVAHAGRRMNDLITRSPIVVMASHDRETIEAFCSRGIVLKQGMIQYDGPIAIAYERYYDIVGAKVA